MKRFTELEVNRGDDELDAATDEDCSTVFEGVGDEEEMLEEDVVESWSARGELTLFLLLA
jgi:hypothetical protein